MDEKNNQWWSWDLEKETADSFPDYSSLMFDKPSIALNIFPADKC